MWKLVVEFTLGSTKMRLLKQKGRPPSRLCYSFEMQCEDRVGDLTWKECPIPGKESSLEEGSFHLLWDRYSVPSTIVTHRVGRMLYFDGGIVHCHSEWDKRDKEYYMTFFVPGQEISYNDPSKRVKVWKTIPWRRGESNPELLLIKAILKLLELDGQLLKDPNLRRENRIRIPSPKKKTSET